MACPAFMARSPRSGHSGASEHGASPLGYGLGSRLLGAAGLAALLWLTVARQRDLAYLPSRRTSIAAFPSRCMRIRLIFTT